jgi:hypothetical protein
MTNSAWAMWCIWVFGILCGIWAGVGATALGRYMARRDIRREARDEGFLPQRIGDRPKGER